MKKQLQDEFDKMVEKGHYVRLADMPMSIQHRILKEKVSHFMSLAPAFKMQHSTTACRATVNGSKVREGRMSFNDALHT